MQVAPQQICRSAAAWLASQAPIGAAARAPAALGWSWQHAQAAGFSTQHEEEIRVPNPSRSQEPGTPPVLGNTGDKKEPGGAHYDAARSSQTVAAQMAGDDAKHLVHKVFEMYESRFIDRQRDLINELYDEGAVYENSVTLLQGRDSIIRRFALLPVTTSSVKVQYEAPMVLGATTSGPEALDNLATKGDLQIEVNNTQSYHFDRGHSMWRYILLPKGDLQLPVLTRLTLNRDGTKVLYHRDIWTHTQEWWAPLQRCWGAIEQAAGNRAATQAKH